MENHTTVAAIQIETKIADTTANMASCERLSLEAVKKGARWIALPEFFTSGICWDTKIVSAIQTLDGPAACFLRDFSARHHVVIGGSFLCRLKDGSVRNRYFCYADGAIVGWHDKDLPTMWENAFYQGGDANDIGVLGAFENTRIGAAVCWEYMRSMTARRLRNRVDVIMGGSCWWSIPTNYPGFLHNLWESKNSRNAMAAIQDSARLIGAPVIHAAHCGKFSCPIPGMLMVYEGFFEGNAAVVDADGKILVHRRSDQGEGVVLAEILLQSQPAAMEIPNRYWLRSRGVIATIVWHHQRWLGRRWYANHVRQPYYPTT